MELLSGMRWKSYGGKKETLKTCHTQQSNTVELLSVVWCVSKAIFSNCNQSHSPSVCRTFIMFFYDLPVCISTSKVM